MDILLSVVVCTYNRQDLLQLCLLSLAEQTLDKSLFEVIVVNNNCTDGTQELAESFAGKYDNFRVVIEMEQGLSHARNRGWREAHGESVAYLDDDSKASSRWCELIVHAFRTVTPRPDAVGGEIHPWYETEPPCWFSDTLELRTWGDHAAFLQPPAARFGFSGSNMAFPRTTLAGLGGFSSHLGMVGKKMRMGEETDLFSRLSARGSRLWYDPAIVVDHWVPETNMRFGYRFTRSYQGGAALAHIDGRRRDARNYMGALLNIGWFLIRSLIDVPASRGGFRRYAAVRLQDLGGRLGYFLG